MDWTTVDSTSTRESAELVADVLRRHGCYVQVVGDEAGGMAPHFELGTTAVDIQVRSEQADKARTILDSYEF